MENERKLKKEIGLLVATALVTGNMIGSGVFMLPATLAQNSGPGASLIAWIITAIGSMLLALSFANMGAKFPKTGGPYEFGKVAFGDFVGFMNAWLYWNASWIGNAAIIISVGSYAGSIIPAISQNHVAGFLFCSAILWIFTFVNIRGVGIAGKFQAFTTVFKLVLFAFFMIVAGMKFNSANLMPMFPAGKGTSTIPAAASITLWAFTGLESASVAAGEIKNPERNIKLSTIFGTLIAAVFYIIISLVAMGAMPQAALAKSSAPITDILALFLGKNIGTFIAAGAVVSVIGSVCGWVFATARMAYAAGEDGVFPKVFAKLHPKYGTPVASLVISAVLVNILLAMNFSKGMTGAFNFIALLATLSYLPIYAVTCLAEMKIMKKENGSVPFSIMVRKSMIPVLGFIYACWTMYGSGFEVCMYGLLLMIAGVPMYIICVYKNKNRVQEEAEA